MEAGRWWILCRVVDNFGDAGVCWRLARQLAREHRLRVELFVDRPELVARFTGGAPLPDGLVVRGWPAPDEQISHEGISGEPTSDEAASAQSALPDVIVSAFGCEPPPPIRALLSGGPPRPLWVNLEYLSAEPWVDGCHGLASVKPQDGAIEHFIYPGFTRATGGLLRERDALAPERPLEPDERAAALQALCAVLPAAGERVISLFCYPDAPIDAWLPALADGDRPTLLLVPEGVAVSAVDRFAGGATAASAPAGQPLRRGNLRVARIPFLPQDDYDRLLRLCDLNFVRGEDSWVRAHWARRPFVWQPYVQQESTHLTKLDAFLARMRANLAPASDSHEGSRLLRAQASVEAMMRAWSGCGEIVAAWRGFESRPEPVAQLFLRWTDSLLARRDLASNLVSWTSRKL